MLSNVLDIEEAMIDGALTQSFPLAVFLDFEAAFPIINQVFIQQVLSARGWPPWFCNFVGIIYDNNYCHLSLSGFTGAGFGITTGVRQGCPLSPLIFAIVSDVLIRSVRRLLPAALIRAYADDIALMLGRGPLDCGLLEVIFAEYAHVSCLRLHHGKSIIVPLSLAPQRPSPCGGGVGGCDRRQSSPRQTFDRATVAPENESRATDGDR